MIIEERYGERVNAEEFSVEVKRGHLYCSPERVNILYLIGRASYINKSGQTVWTSNVIRREPFSKEMMETMLDLKDQLRAQQQEINTQVVRLMNGAADPQLNRAIKIREGWALKETDEV